MTQQTACQPTARQPRDSHTEETDLVRRLLQDDPAAWRTFNAQYSRLIFRCITRVTARFSAVVGTDDTDEIYANLCVQLLAHDKRKLRSFDPSRGSRLGTWVGMLATHAAWDYLRACRRSPRVDDLQHAEELSAVSPDPFEVCSARQRMSLVGEVLAQFPEKDRQFVALYYGEGLSPEQVAEEMGISVKTVYSKKHKIRARLAGLIRRDRLAA